MERLAVAAAAGKNSTLLAMGRPDSGKSYMLGGIPAGFNGSRAETGTPRTLFNLLKRDIYLFRKRRVPRARLAIRNRCVIFAVWVGYYFSQSPLTSGRLPRSIFLMYVNALCWSKLLHDLSLLVK